MKARKQRTRKTGDRKKTIRPSSKAWQVLCCRGFLAGTQQPEQAALTLIWSGGCATLPQAGRHAAHDLRKQQGWGWAEGCARPHSLGQTSNPLGAKHGQHAHGFVQRRGRGELQMGAVVATLREEPTLARLLASTLRLCSAREGCVQGHQLLASISKTYEHSRRGQGPA